jgi:hypothetical protein
MRGGCSRDFVRYPRAMPDLPSADTRGMVGYANGSPGITGLPRSDQWLPSAAADSQRFTSPQLADGNGQWLRTRTLFCRRSQQGDRQSLGCIVGLAGQWRGGAFVTCYGRSTLAGTLVAPTLDGAMRMVVPWRGPTQLRRSQRGAALLPPHPQPHRRQRLTPACSTTPGLPCAPRRCSGVDQAVPRQ